MLAAILLKPFIDRRPTFTGIREGTGATERSYYEAKASAAAGAFRYTAKQIIPYLSLASH